MGRMTLRTSKVSLADMRRHDLLARERFQIMVVDGAAVAGEVVSKVTE